MSTERYNAYKMARNADGNKGTKIDIKQTHEGRKEGRIKGERTEGKQESQKWCNIHIPVIRKHFKTRRIIFLCFFDRAS